MKILTGILLLLGLIVAARADCQEQETEFSVGDSIANGWNMLRGVSGALFATYETAPYETKSHNGSFEARMYPAKKWVCTSQEVEDYDIEADDVDGKMFMKLFRYISGSNEKAMEIAMTTPVSMHYTKHQSTSAQDDDKTAEMCFFIPEEHQAVPAKPNCSDVYIQDRPALEVITIRRGGYPDHAEWEQMWKELERDSQKYTGYDSTNFYTAGYDAPFKFWSRRNEMWFAKST